MPSPLKKKGHKKMGGRKKGTKNKETIAKEQALVRYQQEMLGTLMPLIRSQQQLAQGLVVVLRPKLVKNPKTKKLERTGELQQVRDPDEIERLFNSKQVQGDDYHVIFAKDPNVKALADIFDRVFGKAKEEIDLNITAKAKKLKAIQENIKKALEKE